MVKEMDAANYYKMQIADYVLGNEDRHGANFGFFMDNRSGKLMGLYPLMDHDHAFRKTRIFRPRLQKRIRHYSRQRMRQLTMQRYHLTMFWG